MSSQLSSRRTDRPWPLVALATATWVQPAAMIHTTYAWPLVAGWLLLLAGTVLPLAVTDAARFRRTCLTVGGVVLGAQLAVSLPYHLIPLLFLLPVFPAGPLLLLAAWRRAVLTRGILATVLLAYPALLAFIALCRFD
ncbi:hypothetical protein AB0F71_38560 [Kitasatospora sp. NPDC028055]|uniref:hypothetical protein n=1 Tax=Kitasatospora sp. NPDC028055 TaxID=3155653 RepID=UPI0033F152DC